MTRHSCGSSALLFGVVLLHLAALPVFAQSNRAAGDRDRSVRVASVQFRIDVALASDEAAFKAAAERFVRRAAVDLRADIVVFPEYINVFLLASRYPRIVQTSDSLESAVDALEARTHDKIDLASLVRTHAAEIATDVRAFWSDLARRYGVTIIPGTLFAPALVDGRTEIRNRALVFGPDGKLAYRQDKVYLTEFESDLLQIDAGSLADARPFSVDGLEIGITICRDTYSSAWNQAFGGVDLWIDLRANGEPYSREVYERFLATLPERVSETDAVAGVDASLTGTLLDAVWAGYSYAVNETGTRIARTSSPDGSGIITIDLVPHGDTWRVAVP